MDTGLPKPHNFTFLALFCYFCQLPPIFRLRFTTTPIHAMTRQPEFETASHTDIGKARQTNEDYFGQFSTINGEVFVVCDGMGGHMGGATAARTAVDSIRVFFEHQRYENPVEALRQAFMYANSKIHAAAQQNLEWEGMGTTGVAVLLRDGVAYHAHVGDSRLYRFSGGELQCLTKDQTTVQQMVDKGEITAREAATHPRRNELTQALGADNEVEVEIGTEPLQPEPGDVLMLCTDGLWGALTGSAISLVLAQNLPLQHKAEKLVQAANDVSGADNITVQLIGFQPVGVAGLPPVFPSFPNEDAANAFAKPTPALENSMFENAETPIAETASLKPDILNAETTAANSAANNPTTAAPLKNKSSKPDIALILLCGLAALTIGLFIAGWKYMSSQPVENSELTSVQADTTPEAAETDAEAIDGETNVPAEPVADKPKITDGKPETPVAVRPKEKAKDIPKAKETATTTSAGSTYAHTVRAGETFLGIANRYNLKSETLKSLNPQIKDEAKDLKSDVTQLKIRVRAVHTVGPGDIMNVVSRKYDVPKKLIMAANKKTADRTERGEKLVIPVAEKQ